MPISTAELQKGSLYTEVRAKRARYDQERVPGGTTDSGITDYEVGWDVYDNDLGIYLAEDFNPMFSREDLEDFLNSRRSLVALDFLASTEALASILNRFPQGRRLGLAISREDQRTIQQVQRDFGLALGPVIGDISRPSTWREIEQKLQGKKADLIIERGAGGLDYIPAHRRFYGIALRKAWELLSADNGLMLVQIPKVSTLHALDIDIYAWQDLLAANQISSEYQPYSPSIIFGGALKLVKTLDSPPQLPLLAS